MISQSPLGRRSNAGPVALLPLAAVTALVGIAPFFAALRGSFLHDIYGAVSPAGLENYRFILGDGAFALSLKISLVWALLHTLMTIGLAGIIAFRLWRSLRGAAFLGIMLFIPWSIPVYIAVPIWRTLIHGEGLLINLLLQPVSAFAAALAVSVWLSLPAAVFLIHAGLKKIGRGVFEAARIDGAGEGTIALSICLPAVREIITVAALLEFVKALKEFNVVFLMTAGGPPLLSGITERFIVGATTTLNLFLYDLFLSAEDFGVTSAFSVLTAVAILAATLFYLLARYEEERGKRKLRLVILLLALVQLVTGGPTAPLALLYLLVLPNPRALLPFAVLIHGGAGLFRLLSAGYPAGIEASLIPALLLLLTFGGARGDARIRRLPVWSLVEKPVILLLIAAGLISCLALLWLSFSGLDAVAFRSLLPPHPGFRAYRLALFEEGIPRYFLNSLFVAAGTALLLPFIAFPAARSVAAMSERKSGGILAGLQILGTVSGMHALIPLYAIFRSLGLINSYAGLILIYLEHAFVFSLFTMSAYLRELPPSLEEAARLEGSGNLYFLSRILLPLCRPVIFTAMTVAFLGAWNGFLPALLFIRDDWKYTIGVKLYSLVGSIASGTPRWSIFAAASVLNMAILSLIFLLLRRRGMHSELSEADPA